VEHSLKKTDLGIKNLFAAHKTDLGVKNLFAAHLTRSIGFIFREGGVEIQ
jgi:hypothetical protein